MPLISPPQCLAAAASCRRQLPRRRRFAMALAIFWLLCRFHADNIASHGILHCHYSAIDYLFTAAAIFTLTFSRQRHASWIRFQLTAILSH